MIFSLFHDRPWTKMAALRFFGGRFVSKPDAAVLEPKAGI